MAKLAKYDVGTNFDQKLFDIIKDADKNNRIKNVYGKLRADGLPGGRNTATIPDLTDDQFAQYIKDCIANNVTFNYLINPLCMGQSEIDPEQGKNIRDTIHRMYDIGVRYFTINSPSLIKYVKKEFSDVQVTLGLYAYPVTIQQVEYWRNWGVDEITLDHSFNRNFELLRKLMLNYKDTDFAMRVIANNFCLKECPYRLTHGSFVGHADPEKLSMDYSLINCTYRKVSNPKAMLTSEWIRPEDVHYYDELMEETGYKNFSLKLVDRIRSTEFLENVIRAYCGESYDGNLLDIINWPTGKNVKMPAGNMPPVGGPPASMPSGMPPVGGPPASMPSSMPPVGGPPAGLPPMRHAEKMNPAYLAKYGRTMAFPKMYIDNKKLDGFFEHFVKNNNCANSVCAGTMVEDGKNCSYACNHCGVWAEKAISFNKEEVEQWKAVASEMISDIEKGSMYIK